MSSPPSSSFTSSAPAPPGFYDASSLEADLDWMLRERACVHPSWTLTTTIAGFPTMTYPSVSSQDTYLQALEDMDSGVEGAREAVRAAQLDPAIPLGGLYVRNTDPAPVSSTDPLLHEPMQLDEPGPSQFPRVLPPVFTGTPISQPTPQTPAMDTLAGGAEPDPLPRYFPPGAKLPKKVAFSEHTEYSVFDILNIFRRRWFLSAGHLRAQALSAQKADNGKIFWVEFSPQFHAHLVKCAVALVPRPISKVKKVMFVYILELLNEEGGLAFFDLSKGDRRASAAQKEKKRLARKRNRASRRERRKAAEEAVEGLPQRKCDLCGRKFASRKTAKRHRCPLAKGAVRGAGAVEGTTRMIAPLFPRKTNKPPARIPPSAPPNPPSTASSRPTVPQSRRKRTRAPSSAREAALESSPLDLPDRVFASSSQTFGSTPTTRTSERLNTSKKRRIRRGVMKSVDAAGQL
jgi:hypothetical protein